MEKQPEEIQDLIKVDPSSLKDLIKKQTKKIEGLGKSRSFLEKEMNKFADSFDKISRLSTKISLFGSLSFMRNYNYSPLNFKAQGGDYIIHLSGKSNKTLSSFIANLRINGPILNVRVDTNSSSVIEITTPAVTFVVEAIDNFVYPRLIL